MRTAWAGFILLTAGCAASAGRPQDALFDRAWDEDELNREVQSRDDYLKWVDFFYEGSALVPGWHRRQRALCDALDPAEAPVAASRLDALGRLVASEWAKDNRLRRITTDLVRRMGDILEEARNGGRLTEVAGALLDDVRALLAGGLDPESITPRRYLPEIGYPGWIIVRSSKSAPRAAATSAAVARAMPRSTNFFIKNSA